jgi:hypothetical protein
LLLLSGKAAHRAKSAMEHIEKRHPDEARAIYAAMRK